MRRATRRRVLVVAAALSVVAVAAGVTRLPTRAAATDGAPLQGGVEIALPPLKSFSLLGSVVPSAQHEVWGWGIDPGAPPLGGDGTRLPYAAPGAEPVLLQYTDSGGWHVADVLRNADRSPFPLMPAADQPTTQLFGAMASSGEAWLVLDQAPPNGSQVAPVVGLFHRQPDGGFLDASSDIDIPPQYPTATPADAISLVGAGQISIASDANGVLHGAFTPSSARSLCDSVPVQVRNKTKFATVCHTLFVLDAGRWEPQAIPLPPDPPTPGSTSYISNVWWSGANTGWLKFFLSGTPYWAHDVGGTWTYGLGTGLAVLDLTGPFAGGTVGSLNVLGTTDGAWLDAQVTSPGTRTSSEVLALVDSQGQAVHSWCTIPGQPDACESPIDGASFPSSSVPLPDGSSIAVAPGGERLNVYAHGAWSTVPTPGFAGSSGSALFSGANEGWLIGANALGHWTAAPRGSQLVTWPEANRSPLVSVALPPGSDAGAGAPALAVGFGGTAMHYDPVSGWIVDPVPARTKRLNLLAVAWKDATHAVAVGQFGAILNWDGTGWQEDPQSISLTQSPLDGVAFTPGGGQGWAVGANGTILHWDGTSWSLEQPPADAAGTQITSVAVAGSDVFAIAGGHLIARDAGGAWQDADSQLPQDPAPPPGSLRVASGLPDGGLVLAGQQLVLERQAAGQPILYAPQQVAEIAVAAAAYRAAGGQLRAFLSLAPPTVDPFTGNARDDVAGYPPGDGELVQQGDNGWIDLERAQYPGASTPLDGAVKVDPVLAVASSADGQHAWVVGGYAGTLDSAQRGSGDVLPARPAGWLSASIWRFDAGVQLPPPPAAGAATPDLPASDGTVSLAFLSSAECRDRCSATTAAQPDVNLSAAATQIAAYAQQPGGPAVAVFGGNARGPLDPDGYAAGDGATEFAALPRLLAPLGSVPLYAAHGPLDDVPHAADPSAAWSAAFAGAPAPFGDGPAPASVTPVSAGPAVDGLHRDYAFDVHQNDGTLRAIVIDDSAPLDAATTAWLSGQLQDAQAAGVATVAFAALPLRESAFGAAPGAQDLATLLANGGVSAIFTTNGDAAHLGDEVHAVPENVDPSVQAQVPEYEGATMTYQQPQNGGVLWYLVSVDTRAASRTAAGQAPVTVQGVPVIDSLALKPLDGLSVSRSQTLRFAGLGRRPAGSLATRWSDTGSSFPGYDSYLTLPAAGCTGCVTPAYTFTSADPSIGSFVVASGSGSAFPKLDAGGKPIPSSTSGLFCAFNTGTTTVTISTASRTYSLPVTVRAGGFGPPCGTVPHAGQNPVVVVSAATGAVAPPPPPPPPPAAAASLAKIAPPPPPAAAPPHQVTPPPPPPAPSPAPPPAPAPPAAVPTPSVPPPPAQVVAPPAVLPPSPPVQQPVPPPSGGVSQSPAAARRKEKVHKHAESSAYSLRTPGDSSTDAVVPLLGGAALLAVCLLGLAAGTLRPGRRAAPATLWLDRPRR